MADASSGTAAPKAKSQQSLLQNPILIGGVVLLGILFTPLAILVVPAAVLGLVILIFRNGGLQTADGDESAEGQSGAEETAGDKPLGTETDGTEEAAAGAPDTKVTRTEPPAEPATSTPPSSNEAEDTKTPSTHTSTQAAAVTEQAQAASAAAPDSAAPAPAAPPATTLAADASTPPAAAPAAASSAAAAPTAVTGGQAILARLRQQRASVQKPPASTAPARPAVAFAYGSQTGTAQEIARNLAADALARGLNASVSSLNELGFQNLNSEKTPLLVLVVSSTGDGDPPDNAANLFTAVRKKPASDAAPPLAGVRYSVLGLGDSNYTRFMYVPRVFKTKLAELGAREFYACAEADEVDGVENTVEPWTEGIWGPLERALAEVEAERSGKPLAAAAAAETAAQPEATGKAAAAAATNAATAALPAAKATAPAAELPPQPAQQQQEAAAAVNAVNGLVNGLAPEGVDLKGAPALLPCRLKLDWLPGAPSELQQQQQQEQEADATAVDVLAQEAATPSPEERAVRDPQGLYSSTQPFWARVAGARYETAPWSDRKVLHLELDISGSGICYRPGDSIGVIPQNDAALVEGLLARLGVAGDRVFRVAPAGEPGAPGGHPLPAHLPAGWCSVRWALSRCVELCGPTKKSVLRLLAEHAADEAERRTLLFLTSRAGKDAYAAEVAGQQPTLLDLLRRFPSCALPLEALLDALPPLNARMYSITSSSKEAAGAGRVTFAFSVVSFETRYGTRNGVATTWLERLAQPFTQQQQQERPAATAGHGDEPASGAGALVPVFLRHGGDFGLPQEPDVPLVMIGPGTGVAPFRSFLFERRAIAKERELSSSAQGEVWLFFGCRCEDEDYLYKQDLQALEADGTLTRLLVAFSRAQEEKVYVQHLLRKHGADVWRLIEAGAHVYVCGDGAAMAKDVNATLQQLAVAHGGMSTEAAAAYMTKLAQEERRYIRDIWS